VLLGSLEGGQTNLYDAIYGGPALSLTTETSNSNFGDWSPESGWDMATISMNDYTATAPRSVLSISEESLSSGEDLSTSDLGLVGGQQDFRQTLHSSATAGGDVFLLEGLEGNFGL